MRSKIGKLHEDTLAGDREKCLAAGMDDYLAKPYSVRELRPKLVRWMPARTGSAAAAAA